MTTQEAALVALAEFLERSRIPYMVIGGLANIVWGEPRATVDIDVTVWVPDPEIPAFVTGFSRQFEILVDDPVAFVADTRVLPASGPGAVKIDVIFGLLPFEEEAITRATTVRIGAVAVRVCTAEDLILMKMVSDRERDLSDARELIRRRLTELDFAYLEPRIRDLTRLLERPEIDRRWREWTGRS